MIRQIRSKVTSLANKKTATHCNTLHHTATRCNALRSTSTRQVNRSIKDMDRKMTSLANTVYGLVLLFVMGTNPDVALVASLTLTLVSLLKCVAVCCSVLQCVAVCLLCS